MGGLRCQRRDRMIGVSHRRPGYSRVATVLVGSHAGRSARTSCVRWARIPSSRRRTPSAGLRTTSAPTAPVRSARRRPPHRIEIEGWGEPLLAPDGSFSYPADVNQEQLQHARSDPNWRLEIVGNLTAVRDGTGPAQTPYTDRQGGRGARYLLALLHLARRGTCTHAMALHPVRLSLRPNG